MDKFIEYCLTDQLGKAQRFYRMCNPEDINFDEIFYDLFYELCFDGNLHIAKWLCDIYYKEYNELFRSCCNRGDIKLAKSLYELNDVDIYDRDPSELYGVGNAFEYACLYNNLEIAKWLFDISDKAKLNIYSYIDIIFVRVGSNDLEMLQWVYTLSEYDDTILRSAFMEACLGDKIDNAKWLYSLGTINVHAHDDAAFVESCISGHLDVAKWLYYELGDVNIHAYSCNSNKERDYAFKWSLYMGKLDVAQWLYSLDGEIDVRSGNDQIFKYICEKPKYKFNHKFSRSEIARWLCTLCEDYSVEILGDDIKYMIRKIENINI